MTGRHRRAYCSCEHRGNGPADNEALDPPTTRCRLNHPDRLLADPVGFAQRRADLLDLDAGRLRQWLIARCVQESLDEPRRHAVANDLAPWCGRS